MYLDLSHKIESKHTDEDQESTTKDTHIEAVVNTDASLPLSYQIESECMDEEPTVKDTDIEAAVNPDASLPLSCDNDALINMETVGFNFYQTEVDNTQVKGQASDLFLDDHIIDLIGGYSKQNNIEHVTYSHSSGSASPGDICAINEMVCGSNDYEPLDFKMSCTLK